MRAPRPRTLLALGLISAGLAALTGTAAAQHPNHAQGFRPEHVFDMGGIEHVNLFNGNLTLTIPIGGSYPLGPELSYGLTLTWTGNVWRWDERVDGNVAYLQAEPRAAGRTSAGLGWELSFGRLVNPEDPDNPAPGFTYQTPDQALHPFVEHGASGDVYRSTDSTYLRLKESVDSVEAPDGTVQTFGLHGLARMEDPFGHGLTIEYLNVDSFGDPLLWRITDDHGRVHEIVFERRVGRPVVTRVELESFTGADTPATYTFSYSDQFVPRPCNEPVTDPGCSGVGNLCGNTSNVQVPLLTEVRLPDDSVYSMPVGSYELGESGACPNSRRLLNGALERLSLPTGGTFEWDWQIWSYPVESRHLAPLDGGSPPGITFTSAPGVGTRRHLTRANGILGEWTYQQTLKAAPGYDRLTESQTEVTDPLGHRAVHYFSVYHDDFDPATAEPPGWDRHDYGLPFTRRLSDGSTPKRFLSRQVFDKTGADCCLLRSAYVRYERDGDTPDNPRMASRRTVYHDDGGRRADLDLSDFDGLGHYRRAIASGTFQGATSRTTFTNWNPSGAPADSAPWVLDTYDEVSTTEGTQTVTRELDFDPATGFLKRTRIRKAAACGGEDVIVDRIRKPGSDAHFGFLAREDFYGGDGSLLPCGALGDVDLTAQPIAYRRKHDYTCGVLRKSQWFEASGAAVSFSAPDLDIHCGSGLVATSRDTTGLATTFDYDLLGRLTLATLPTGEGASTSYQYDREGTNNLPARVTVQRKDGSTALTEEQVRFDGFGRVAEERRKMPDGTLAVRKTSWSALGWIDQRREWEAEGDGDPSPTLFRQYDPFGRPGTVTLPDGEKISISYSGESSRTITVPVATGTDAAGEPTSENASTTETYDRFGRLVKLVEPNGTPTQYGYDALGNLSRVDMNVGGTPVQTRTFGYDHRGALRTESHPELGTSIVYSDYDPLGNPGRIERGGWDLAYTYDRASRLTEIRERGTDRVWKEWTYAEANGEAGLWSNGKLATAVRYNRVFYPGTSTEIAVPVTEDYVYDGLGGRISRVTTTIVAGSKDENTQPVFEYGLSYDPLGNPLSRSYPDCSHLHCVSKSPDRTVFSAYTEGLLTAVTGFASSISYHPNGLVHRVAHAHGVTDIQENDPDDLQRPLRLRTTGASEDFDTGGFDYDGAGNVTKIGSSVHLYDLLSRVVWAEVPMVPDACGEDLHLESVTYSSTSSEEVCGEIFAGAGVRVTTDGDVTFRAGDRVVLGDGFQVEAGGRFVAEVDPTLEPTGATSEATWSGKYDLFGNLTEMTLQRPGETEETRTPVADPATNRLSSLTSYDLSGNLTSWENRSFRYDPFNMLRESATYVFLYGPGDERIWTIDWTAGAADTSWVEAYVLRDLDGAPLRQYELRGGNYHQDNWSVKHDFVWRGGGLLAAVTAGATEHFHLDHLGTPRLVTDDARNKSAYHAYFPFGEEATSFLDATIPLQYTGHERDDLDTTGTTRDLDYMHARYFSATVGRFHSPDPVGGALKTPQSWNRYSYVLGNPVKNVDPYGLFPVFFPLGDFPIATFGEEITTTTTGLPHGYFGFLTFGSFLRNIGLFSSGLSLAPPAPRSPAISNSSRCASIVPAAPPGVSIAQNIQHAEQHRGNLLWLVNQVKTGGPWDYKQAGRQYESFGNFHYGVVFAAGGISPEVSLLGAGVYQALSGTSKAEWMFPHGAEGLFDPMDSLDKPFLNFPYGDDPADSLSIMNGITFFQDCVQ